MQHLYGANVVALLSGEVEKVLSMWHLELPEMKGEVVVVALFKFPTLYSVVGRRDRSKGKFGRSGHKPRNGLLRTLSGFQKVLRRPVRGFRVQGAQKRSSYRAIEGTLNT